MNKAKNTIMERATKGAKNCIDYREVDFFRDELSEMRDLYPMEADCLERNAMRSALANLLKHARMDAEMGYRTDAEREEITQNINEYRSCALRLAKELGINENTIAKKFDNLKIEPYKDMKTLMREWYPNPIQRTYKRVREGVKQLFSNK